MSSNFPSTGERAEVPQPVKKRGRFANVGEVVNTNFGEHQAHRQSGQREPVPEGFVRYELDEEDSEDDPDFEAEADPVEEEEEYDQYEDLEDINNLELAPDNARRSEAQLNHILTQSRTQTPRRRYASRVESPRGLAHDRDICHELPTPIAPFEGTREEDPEFEVDDPDFEVDNLDSTDEEDELDESERGGDDDEGGNGDIPEDNGEFSGVHLPDEVEVDELDEAESDEDDDDIEEEEDAEDGDEQAGPDEYQQFLMGLLADTGDPRGASDEAGANGITGGLPPPSWALDDDDDFDYLRESARVQDDPLEFRDDLQVSRKELVQLFSNSTAGGLRRQTRHSRIAQGSRQRQPSAAVPMSGAIAASSVVVPSVQMPTAIIPSLRASSAEPLPAQNSFASFIAPPHASFMNLPAHSLYQFREQLSVHVQILTTIYAETKKASRTIGDKRPGNSSQETADVRTIHAAANRSEMLLRGLVENKKVSALYHQAVGTNLSRLKGFSERLLHRDRNSSFTYESCKFSVYNLPVLDLLEPFISDCMTADVADMPAGVLERFKNFDRPDIAQALRARPHGRQYSASGSRPGWFPWTAEDDRLLAMTMAKYGSDEVGQFSKDLLPHRQEDDCQTRVRYLSSRRCPDNPVKRQVTFITSPLNKDEVELVRHGLIKFGRGNNEDPSVWKRIQAELLPGREWSHLQKLWNWRETRRKYKAKYRAKSYQKKKAMRGTAPA